MPGAEYTLHSQFGISHTDLNKVKYHICMYRAAVKLVRHGRMNVGNEAVSGIVYTTYEMLQVREGATCSGKVPPMKPS